jgi:hypothetical protein
MFRNIKTENEKAMKPIHLLVLGSTEPLEVAMICEKALDLISANKTVIVIDLISDSNKPLNFYFAERINLFKLKASKKIFINNGINVVTINKKMHNVKVHNSELRTAAERAAQLELIAVKRDINPCEHCCSKQRKKLVNVYLQTYLKMEDFCNEFEPECIYLYNGRFLLGNACWQLANKYNLKILFLENILMNKPNKYWVFEEPVHSTIYRYKTINNFIQKQFKSNPKVMTKSASEWYNKRIDGTGQSFTSNQNILYVNKSPKKILVSFFTSSEDELILLGLEDPVFGDQKRIILELTKYFSELASIHFVIRLHPNTSHKSSHEIRRWLNFKDYITDKYKFVEFINAPSKVNSYSLIKASNLVITAGSTVNLEAAYLKIPTVLMGKGLYKDLQIAYTPSTYVEFFANFSEYLENNGNKHYDNALKVGAFHNHAGLTYRFVRTDKSGKNIEVFGHKLSNSKIFGVALKFDKLFLNIRENLLHSILHERYFSNSQLL